MGRLPQALLLVSAVALLGCARGGGAAQSPAQRYQSDAAALKRGRLLFTGTCGAYCHPTKPAHRDAPYLFDCSWKHGGSDREIFASISKGIPGTRMPAWQGKLPKGDEDIWKVIAYLRAQRSCAAR